jgi:hypothetical protein
MLSDFQVNAWLAHHQTRGYCQQDLRCMDEPSLVPCATHPSRVQASVTSQYPHPVPTARLRKRDIHTRALPCSAYCCT